MNFLAEIKAHRVFLNVSEIGNEIFNIVWQLTMRESENIGGDVRCVCHLIKSFTQLCFSKLSGTDFSKLWNSKQTLKSDTRDGRPHEDKSLIKQKFLSSRTCFFPAKRINIYYKKHVRLKYLINAVRSSRNIFHSLPHKTEALFMFVLGKFMWIATRRNFINSQLDNS